MNKFYKSQKKKTIFFYEIDFIVDEILTAEMIYLRLTVSGKTSSDLDSQILTKNCEYEMFFFFFV